MRLERAAWKKNDFLVSGSDSASIFVSSACSWIFPGALFGNQMRFAGVPGAPGTRRGHLRSSQESSRCSCIGPGASRKRSGPNFECPGSHWRKRSRPDGVRESFGSALVTPGYPSGYHFPHMFGKSTGTDFVDRYIRCIMSSPSHIFFSQCSTSVSRGVRRVFFSRDVRRVLRDVQRAFFYHHIFFSRRSTSTSRRSMSFFSHDVRRACLATFGDFFLILAALAECIATLDELFSSSHMTIATIQFGCTHAVVHLCSYPQDVPFQNLLASSMEDARRSMRMSETSRTSAHETIIASSMKDLQRSA